MAGASVSVAADRDYAEAARAFLARALAVHTVDQVAAELLQTLHATLGARSCLLIVSDHTGALRVLGAPGAPPELASCEAAFERMALRSEPLRRARLVPEDQPVAELLERLGGEIALALKHRGALIAIAIVGACERPLGGHEFAFLRRLAHEASVAVANAYLYVARQGKARTRRQVSLATAMQDALVPEARPIRRGAMLLRGLYRPAGECGGDFWTWEDLGNGRLLVAVGDVTGKGVPAAMLAATAKGVAAAVRVARGPALDPAEFLRLLNGAIFRAARTRWLMTCIALVVDTERGELLCANAGHHFPYLLGATSGLHQIVVRGNALGASPICSYTVEPRLLAPGESLLLYTDGIIDAAAQGGEPFGEKRLRRLLEHGGAGGGPLAPGTLAERLLGEMREHVGAGAPADDVTLVELAREGSTL